MQDNVSPPDRHRYLAQTCLREYRDLTNATGAAISNGMSNDLIVRVKRAVIELGFLIIELIDRLGQPAEKKPDIDRAVDRVIEKVCQTIDGFSSFHTSIQIHLLLSIVQGQTHVPQLCQQAATSVNSIIADLVSNRT
jgi:hypothetical protein